MFNGMAFNQNAVKTSDRTSFSERIYIKTFKVINETPFVAIRHIRYLFVFF